MFLLLLKRKNPKTHWSLKADFSWGIPEGKNFLTVSNSRKQPNRQQVIWHILILMEQLRDTVERKYCCFCITGQMRIHSFHWETQHWNLKCCSQMSVRYVKYRNSDVISSRFSNTISILQYSYVDVHLLTMFSFVVLSCILNTISF